MAGSQDDTTPSLVCGSRCSAAASAQWSGLPLQPIIAKDLKENFNYSR